MFLESNEIISLGNGHPKLPKNAKKYLVINLLSFGFEIGIVASAVDI